MFSMKAVLAKIIYTHYSATAIPVLTLRMVFALPFYLIILFRERLKNSKNLRDIQKSDFWKLLLFGLLGYYLASYFDFVGLQYIKAGLERIILFCYPTIVILFSWIFLKRKPTKKQVMAILMTYIGVLICFWNELHTVHEGQQIILGGVLILLSAIFYAGYLVGSDYLIPKFGSVLFTSYAMLVACFAIITHFLVTNGVHIFHYEWQVYILCLIMAIFSTVLPSYFISASIRELNANNFGVVASLGPVSTIILAYFFLGEVLTPIQIIGSLIVIIGIFIITRGKKKKK